MDEIEVSVTAIKCTIACSNSANYAHKCGNETKSFESRKYFDIFAAGGLLFCVY